MRLSGIQYYWLIVYGLIAGLLLAPFAEILVFITQGDPVWIMFVFLLILLPAIVSLLVVALEIWNRFGVLYALIAFVLYPICTVYWLSRIRGFPDDEADR